MNQKNPKQTNKQTKKTKKAKKQAQIQYKMHQSIPVKKMKIKQQKG